MKKITATGMLLTSALYFAQIGINTPEPKTTFDIVSKNETGKSRTPEGLLIPNVDRERAQSMADVPISTLIYVNSIDTGDQTGTAANIDNVGYYYFDGNEWVKLNMDLSSFKDNDNNIYNTDGTLTSNRNVNVGNRNLTFGTTGAGSIYVDGNNNGLTRSFFRNTNTDVNSRNDINIGAGNSNNIYVGVDNSSNFYGNGPKSYIANYSNGPFVIGSGNNAQMALATTGNVGIGTIEPSLASVLDLSSTNRGFLPPRLTTTERNGISNIPAGLTIYNTTTNCMEFWNSSSWISTCGVTAPVQGSITALNCSSATNNGNLYSGASAASVSSVVPYTGGNGASHLGQTVTSTGVTGLTATLSAGSFVNGNGTVTYAITGTPSGTGNANFVLNIGGQTCTLTRVVSAGAIGALNCGSATNSGNLIAGASASGVSSVIPYTGGTGGSHSGQTITSTGVTGLTATLSAGSFANGNGTVTYIITGTPSGAGTANFAINIGGQTCTLSLPVDVAIPTPNLTTSCNGWAMPYLDWNRGSATGNVNGKSVTATTSNSTSNHFNNWKFICGMPSSFNETHANQFREGQTNNIKFNRPVSNLLIYFSGFAGNRASIEFYRNGKPVTPTSILANGQTCTSSFTVTTSGNKITVNKSNLSSTSNDAIAYHMTDVWFDEMRIKGEVSSTGEVKATGIAFCLGAAL